jgi:hypothetical protein
MKKADLQHEECHMIKADLHIHSTVSDGSLTLEKIICNAVKTGITHLSITDHDTTFGTPEAVILGMRHGIAIIPGVEFSAYDYTNNVRAHILGYGMTNFSPIEQLGSPLLRKRHNNSLRQIEVLDRLGYDMTAEEVARKSGRHIYKQHIMQVMVEKGYAESIGGEIFRMLFKNGGPCDFDIDYIDARDAVAAVKEAGGVAILAHPGQQGNFGSIPGLVDAGLAGLEYAHHANNIESRAIIFDFAQRSNLLLTGGSDCHGIYENNSPEIGSFLCPEVTILKMMEMGLC